MLRLTTRRKLMSKMKEYLLDQYEQKITPEIDDLIKIREESSMPKWIVITEVESEVDPAVFNYVNGTTLISSQLKEEVSE
jgi:hypothetical protein